MWNWKAALAWGGRWIGCALAGVLMGCGGGGGGEAPSPGAPAVAAGTLRVHYQRDDGAYAGWGVYAWKGPKAPSSGWPGAPRYEFTGADGYGRYVDIPLDLAAGRMEFLLNKPDGSGGADKDGDCDRVAVFAADVATRGQQVWLKQGDCAVYASADAAAGHNLAHARALWLDRSRLVWPGAPASGRYRLHHAAAGGMKVGPAGVQGSDGAVDLEPAALPEALRSRFPHVAAAPAWALPAEAWTQVPEWLKGQLVVTREVDGRVVAATRVQVQGVLDDVYATAATRETLGVSFAGDGTPTFRLWAPTARSVHLQIVGGPRVAMQRDAASGVWSHTGPAAWTDTAYYTYAVEVYTPAEDRVVTHTVTDPYATTLNANGQAAMVARIAGPAYKPAGWDGHPVPTLAAPEDAVIYELHVRDFSIGDATVPAGHRGKYTAFAQPGTAGMTHLAALAQAGVTHVHLLPTYDLATIDEVGCTDPTVPAAGGTSTEQQAAISAAKDRDCFNWGYDPRHYGAPEGSYSTDPHDGAVRVREFRQMVMGLHAAGLRVVLDVVYNHTSGNFLDRIVPGYYYRLNADGFIEKSTCCENTAPEFAMMEKLMLDTLRLWATEYRVDGFRFDIMGHLPKSAIVKAQQQTDAAAGRPLYYYGEAWNFGEVANDRLFVQARQANLAGTGVGSFSDRIRDALRGGGPFDAGEDMLRHQGFVNGRCYDNNELNAGPCTDAQRADLHYRQDLIRLGLAGSLRDFMLRGKPAWQYDYGGQPAGYTDDPQEVINYAGVHDGETLYDVSQYKHPAALPARERARAQVVALGTVLMGQGVPFIHAGDELLRTKSLDRDSYNSGDWFNRIDWTASTHLFGQMGLPPAEKNQDGWPLMRPILGNPAARADAAVLAATRDAVLDLLRVRKDTTMLRLRTGEQVRQCLSFPDEADPRDGLIVMRIAGAHPGGACGDGKYASLIVFINANDEAQALRLPAYQGRSVALHPVLAAGSDPRVRTATFDPGEGRFQVPARTVAVFVEQP